MSILARIAWNWGMECFGWDHMNNERERAIRLVEEAIELCQAVGVEGSLVKAIADDVYAKAPGDPAQELGGVFVTANVMAINLGLEPEGVFEREVTRVVLLPKEHFAKRNQSKRSVA